MNNNLSAEYKDFNLSNEDCIFCPDLRDEIQNSFSDDYNLARKYVYNDEVGKAIHGLNYITCFDKNNEMSPEDPYCNIIIFPSGPNCKRNVDSGLTYFKVQINDMTESQFLSLAHHYYQKYENEGDILLDGFRSYLSFNDFHIEIL